MNQQQLSKYAQLISSGEIKSAISFLLNTRQEDRGLMVEAISMMSRLNNIESKFNSGLVDFEDYRIELNQIIQAATKYLYHSGISFLNPENENIHVLEKTENLIQILLSIRSKGSDYKLSVNHDVPVRFIIVDILNKFDGKELNKFIKDKEYLDAILCKKSNGVIVSLNPEKSLKDNDVIPGDNLFLQLELKNNTFFKV